MTTDHERQRLDQEAAQAGGHVAATTETSLADAGDTEMGLEL